MTASFAGGLQNGGTVTFEATEIAAETAVATVRASGGSGSFEISASDSGFRYDAALSAVFLRGAGDPMRRYAAGDAASLEIVIADRDANSVRGNALTLTLFVVIEAEEPLEPPPIDEPAEPPPDQAAFSLEPGVFGRAAARATAFAQDGETIVAFADQAAIINAPIALWSIPGLGAADPARFSVRVGGPLAIVSGPFACGDAMCWRTGVPAGAALPAAGEFVIEHFFHADLLSEDSSRIESSFASSTVEIRLVRIPGGGIAGGGAVSVQNRYEGAPGSGRTLPAAGDPIATLALSGGSDSFAFATGQLSGRYGYAFVVTMAGGEARVALAHPRAAGVYETTARITSSRYPALTASVRLMIEVHGAAGECGALYRYDFNDPIARAQYTVVLASENPDYEPGLVLPREVQTGALRPLPAGRIFAQGDLRFVAWPVLSEPSDTASRPVNFCEQAGRPHSPEDTRGVFNAPENFIVPAPSVAVVHSDPMGIAFQAIQGAARVIQDSPGFRTSENPDFTARCVFRDDDPYAYQGSGGLQSGAEALANPHCVDVRPVIPLDAGENTRITLGWIRPRGRVGHGYVFDGSSNGSDSFLEVGEDDGEVVLKFSDGAGNTLLSGGVSPPMLTVVVQEGRDRRDGFRNFVRISVSLGNARRTGTSLPGGGAFNDPFVFDWEAQGRPSGNIAVLTVENGFYDLPETAFRPHLSASGGAASGSVFPRTIVISMNERSRNRRYNIGLHGGFSGLVYVDFWRPAEGVSVYADASRSVSGGGGSPLSLSGRLESGARIAELDALGDAIFELENGGEWFSVSNVVTAEAFPLSDAGGAPLPGGNRAWIAPYEERRRSFLHIHARPPAGVVRLALNARYDMLRAPTHPGQGRTLRATIEIHVPAHGVSLRAVAADPSRAAGGIASGSGTRDDPWRVSGLPADSSQIEDSHAGLLTPGDLVAEPAFAVGEHGYGVNTLLKLAAPGSAATAALGVSVSAGGDILLVRNPANYDQTSASDPDENCIAVQPVLLDAAGQPLVRGGVFWLSNGAGAPNSCDSAASDVAVVIERAPGAIEAADARAGALGGLGRIEIPIREIGRRDYALPAEIILGAVRVRADPALTRVFAENAGGQYGGPAFDSGAVSFAGFDSDALDGEVVLRPRAGDGSVADIVWTGGSRFGRTNSRIVPGGEDMFIQIPGIRVTVGGAAFEFAGDDEPRAEIGARCRPIYQSADVLLLGNNLVDPAYGIMSPSLTRVDLREGGDGRQGLHLVLDASENLAPAGFSERGLQAGDILYEEGARAETERAVYEIGGFLYAARRTGADECERAPALGEFIHSGFFTIFIDSIDRPVRLRLISVAVSPGAATVQVPAGGAVVERRRLAETERVGGVFPAVQHAAVSCAGDATLCDLVTVGGLLEADALGDIYIAAGPTLTGGTATVEFHACEGTSHCLPYSFTLEVDEAAPFAQLRVSGHGSRVGRFPTRPLALDLVDATRINSVATVFFGEGGEDYEFIPDRGGTIDPETGDCAPSPCPGFFVNRRGLLRVNYPLLTVAGRHTITVRSMDPASGRIARNTLYISIRAITRDESSMFFGVPPAPDNCDADAIAGCGSEIVRLAGRAVPGGMPEEPVRSPPGVAGFRVRELAGQPPS